MKWPLLLQLWDLRVESGIMAGMRPRFLVMRPLASVQPALVADLRRMRIRLAGSEGPRKTSTASRRRGDEKLSGSVAFAQQ